MLQSAGQEGNAVHVGQSGNAKYWLSGSAGFRGNLKAFDSHSIVNHLGAIRFRRMAEKQSLNVTLNGAAR
jgi:hypothetical protein